MYCQITKKGCVGNFVDVFNTLPFPHVLYYILGEGGKLKILKGYTLSLSSHAQ